MQQAYQALRVISEAQTVHIVLTAHPGTLMLAELRTACQALQERSSDGIKAVILDLVDAQPGSQEQNQSGMLEPLAQAKAAVRAIPQPVLFVARASLSQAACSLLAEADFTLIAHEAELSLPAVSGDDTRRIAGATAARLGYATWSAPTVDLDREMKRILDMLRTKSALALRHAKASTRLVPAESAATGTQLETLQRINQFYLEKVMATQDAREGLQAFLEKRSPHWHNR